MNLKTKKALIISGTALAVSAVIGASIGVYFSLPNITRISQNGIYAIRTQSKFSLEGYMFDKSKTYGDAKSNTDGVLLTSNLIRIKSEGRMQLGPNGEIVKPSYQSFQFELAKSVVVKMTNSDGSEVFDLVFDSDEAENEPNFLSGQKDVVVSKTSGKNNSINNQEIFWKLLNNGGLAAKIKLKDIVTEDILPPANNPQFYIKSIGFTIKPGVNWVDSNGNKTKYQVVAEDFQYSFMRTKLFDTKYRVANGGSEELDKYFTKKTNAKTFLQKTNDFPNEYLYGLFDLDSTKMYSAETSIDKKDDSNDEDDVFYFSSLEGVGQTNGFAEVINKMILTNMQLSPAPSQYIKELEANEALNNPAGMKITGAARKYGIYTYGQTREQTYFASAYIPTKITENTVHYTYNKHFAIRKFVDDVQEGFKKDGVTYKAMKEIVFEYAGSTIDSTTFYAQLLNSYMNGTISEIDYSQLNNSQRQQIYGKEGDTIDKIKETAAKNGLQYSKKINTSSLAQRTILQSNPRPVDNTKDYYFDDNYAKLMFGADLNELASGQAVTSNAFYLEKGFRFRNLIQSSINWHAYIKQAYSDQKYFWLSNAAENAKFSSLVGDTPLDHKTTVNTISYLKSDGSFVDIKPEDMEKQTTDEAGNNLKQLQSPKYDEIKTEVQTLLDEFYSENNLDKSKDKVSWKIIYPWPDKNTKITSIMTEMIKNLEGLDPEHKRLKVELVIPSSMDETIAGINKNRAYSDFNGWGYDYEGTGSYITAFVVGYGVSLMNAFQIYSQEGRGTDTEVTKLQQQFPQFTNLAKFIKKETDEEMKALGVNKKYWVENWHLLNNDNHSNLVNYFLKETGGKYNPKVSLGRMLKQYEVKMSDGVKPDEASKNWAQLLKEMNMIKGVSLDTGNAIDNPDLPVLKLILREYHVPVTKFGINYFQDYLAVIK